MPDERGTLSYATRQVMGTVSYPFERTHEIPWHAEGGIAVQIAARRVPSVENYPGDPNAVAVKLLHGGLSRLPARVVRPHPDPAAVALPTHLPPVRKPQPRPTLHHPQPHPPT